jgi:hypothetical protein
MGRTPEMRIGDELIRVVRVIGGSFLFSFRAVWQERRDHWPSAASVIRQRFSCREKVSRWDK